MTATQRPPRRDLDAWWVVVIFAAGAALGAALLGAAIGLFTDRRGMATVQDLGGALGAWWFLRGAWLRTTWGRPDLEAVPDTGEPPLAGRRLARFLWLAVACVLAAGVALAVQLAGIDR